MAKRYYVCDVIGSGTRTDPYRPAVDGLAPHNRVAVIRPPAWLSCLVLVAAPNHTAFVADPRVDALPDLGLGTAWFAAEPVAAGVLLGELAGRGFSTAHISAVVSFGAVLRGLGQQIDPAFTELNFDVAELMVMGTAAGALAFTAADPGPQEVDGVWVLS